MRGYTVDVHAEIHTRADVSALRRLARRALRVEGVRAPAELSVLLTGDKAIRRLNRVYGRKNAPTDVLSFAQGEGAVFARATGTAAHLGDVIVSVETARRQAREFRVSLQDELSHLLVHGILHLLGYEHDDAPEAAVMRAREDAILGRAHHH